MPKLKLKKKLPKKATKKSSQVKVPAVQKTMVVAPTKKYSNVEQKKSAKMTHKHGICSVLDPFCIHARGAQRPDGGPATITFQIRTVISQTAYTTTGAARFIYIANPLYQYGTSTLAANTWTNTSAWSTAVNVPLLTSHAKELRITSFGCIVRCALSATTAKGLVYGSVDPTPVVSATADQGSLQAGECQVVQLAPGMEHAWVSKPVGKSAHLFQPISKYTSTMSDFDWTCLVVEVGSSDTTSGVPLVSTEYVMNVEFTVGTGVNAGISQLARAPPPPNPVAVRGAEIAQNSISSFIEGGIARVGAKLENVAMNALDTLIADGMALLTL